MKLSDFTVITYPNPNMTCPANKKVKTVCYVSNEDIHSKEMRKEFNIPEDVRISIIPQQDWPIWAITQIMNYFFDDRCKSGEFYSPSNYKAILDNTDIKQKTKKKILYELLLLIEAQFGY